MAISIHDELDTLYDKFDQAERKWLNRFDDLDGHYEKALRNFTSNLPKGSGAPTGAQDTVDIASNVIIGGFGLAGGPAIIAVPVVLGLKKLATLVDGGAVSPPEPDLMSLQNKFRDIKKAFKKTTEYIGDEIIKLKDKAKQAVNGSGELGIREGISKLLLSPIWYPPANAVTANPGLAQAFELRMWFAYFKQLVKMPPAKQLQGLGGIDYSPMYKHFKEIGWAPQGMEIVRLMMPGRTTWLAKGDNYHNLKKLNEFGEKNKEFKLQHSYPKDVEKYLSMVKMVVSVTPFLNGQSALPHSDLGWADVSI